MDVRMTRRSMLAFAFAAALLSGCNTMRSLVGMDPKPVAPDWKALTLRAADDANSNSAIAVDVVLVKDAAMLDSLTNMPAAKWFATRAELQRTFPEALTVYPYELVPNQTVKLNDKKWNGQKAWAALVFAGYANAGEHRARLLLNNAGYVVQLNAQGFSASELKPGAPQ
jgi:type VI secretion system protein